MQNRSVLLRIFDIYLIFTLGLLLVDGNLFNLNLGSHFRNIQTRIRDSAFRASLANTIPVQSQPISFHLFTRENRRLPEIIAPWNASFSEYYSRDKETKIIIHSFMQAMTDKIYLQIKDAYLNKKDVNVILADWPHARLFTYSRAATVTEYVGKETVKLIKALNAPLDRVHIIGFGLGAHSGGIAGSELLNQVGRITGLDPSMRLFRMLDDYFRLDENDGKFVDIIHTDAGDNFWFVNHLGLGKPSGSVDLYPNKGIFQPGCLNTSILNYEDMYCSHVRSLELFAESIENPENLMACKCSSWASFMDAKCDCRNEENLIFVGEGKGTATQHVTGKYYLITNERKPYGMGKPGSRSPRENSIHNILEDLDKLSKIIVSKGGDNQLTNLRSLADGYLANKEQTSVYTPTDIKNETEDKDELVPDVVAKSEDENSAVADVPISVDANSAEAEVPISEDANSAVAEVPISEAANSAVAEVPISEDANSAVAEVPISEDANSAVAEVPISEDANSAEAEVPISEDANSAEADVPISEEAKENEDMDDTLENELDIRSLDPGPVDDTQYANIGPDIVNNKDFENEKHPEDELSVVGAVQGEESPPLNILNKTLNKYDGNSSSSNSKEMDERAKRIKKYRHLMFVVGSARSVRARDIDELEEYRIL